MALNFLDYPFVEIIMLGRQDNFLEFAADTRNIRQVYSVICDSKELMEHCLISPLVTMMLEYSFMKHYFLPDLIKA